MEKEQLQIFQKEQLNILKEVHAVCTEHHLTYYIICGTALGAVRHGGFIPWDPDIDIAMPREDYDRFVNHFWQQMDEKYRCVSMKDYKDYVSPHAIVYLKNSRLKKHKPDYFRNELRPVGIYLDVMPLDVAPMDADAQERQAKAIARIKYYRQWKLYSLGQSKGFKRKITRLILRMLLFPVSMRFFNNKLEKEITRYSDDKESTLWCSMTSHYSYKKQCMPISMYGTPTLIRFEGLEVYGPEQMTDYLKRIYGDYMALPPLAERQKSANHFDSVEVW